MKKSSILLIVTLLCLNTFCYAQSGNLSETCGNIDISGSGCSGANGAGGGENGGSLGPGMSPPSQSVAGTTMGDPIDVNRRSVVRRDIDFSLATKHGHKLEVSRYYTSRKMGHESSLISMYGRQWFSNYSERLALFEYGGDLFYQDSNANYHRFQGVNYFGSMSFLPNGAILENSDNKMAPLRMTVVGENNSSRRYELVFADRSMKVFDYQGKIIEHHASVNNNYDDHLTFIYDANKNLIEVHAPSGDGRFLKYDYISTLDNSYRVSKVALHSSTLSGVIINDIVFYQYDTTMNSNWRLENVRYNTVNNPHGFNFSYGSYDTTGFTYSTTNDNEIGMIRKFSNGIFTPLVGYTHFRGDIPGSNVFQNTMLATKYFRYDGNQWNHILSFDSTATHSMVTYNYSPKPVKPVTAFAKGFQLDTESVLYTDADPKAEEKYEAQTGYTNGIGQPLLRPKKSQKINGVWHLSSDNIHNYSAANHLDKFNLLSFTQYAGLGATNPRTTTYTYNSTFGHLVSTITDPSGNTTSYAYYSTSDARNGKLQSITKPGNIVTTYTYYLAPSANAGLPYQVISPTGTTTFNSYDQYGNATSITGPDGNVSTMTYNRFGQIVSKSATNLGTTQYVYSIDAGIPTADQYSPSRLVKIIDSNGDETRYEYDGFGNVTKVIDDNGNFTLNEYNNFHQLVAVTNPAGDRSTYTYDAIGRMVAFRDGESAKAGGHNQATQYVYDDFGRITKETDPNGFYEEYTYGSGGGCGSCGGGSGNDVMIRKREKDGTFVSYDYNHAGQLTAVDYESIGTAGSDELAYNYDGIGRLLSLWDYRLPSGMQAYFWNYYNSPNTPSHAKLSKITHPEGHFQEYYYDNLGRMSAYRDIDGGLKEYTYDTLGRLDKIEDPFHQFTTWIYSNTSETTFPVGSIKQVNYSNGTRNAYTYDSLGRFKRVNYHPFASGSIMDFTEVAYNNLGLITEKYRQVSGATVRTSYSYDPAYRLISEQFKNSTGVTQATKSYTYDKAGNRKSLTQTNTAGANITTLQNFGNRNQLSTGTIDEVSQYAGFVNAYNAKGNLTQKNIEYDDNFKDQIWDYTWNEDNRLTQSRAREWNNGTLSFDTTVSYLYDYAGRRILKRAGTAASAAERTRFFFNGLTEEIKKVSVSGAHADNAFSRQVLYATGGPTGGTNAYDSQRRNTVSTYSGWREAGTMAWGTGNGLNITGLRTFATWLRGVGSMSDYEFALHFNTSLGRKAVYYRTSNFANWTSADNKLRFVSLQGKTGDFDSGAWVRLERDFTDDLAAAWPGITNVTVTGWHLWSPVGATIGMDGLAFSNSLTVQHNVLGGGAVGHILVTQNITPSTMTENRVWHHYDQVGSVMMTSNAGGGLIQQRLADAFGNTISSHFTGTWIDSWTASGHNTKEYDSEADLVYMYQRWYDPKTGTFASMDPIKDGSNFYIFVENNPLLFHDPNGLYKVDSSCTSCDPDPLAGVKDDGSGERKSDPAQTQSCKDSVESLGITDEKVKSCMKKFCDNGTISCKKAGDYNCKASIGPDGNPGYPLGGQTDSRNIFICPTNIRDTNSGGNLREILLHEMAHACGWSHSDGPIGTPGIPGSDGRLH
jgi:RHS repeat-associated protein